MHAELAQIGGIVGAAGLAILLLAPAGRVRLVGLVAWAAGGAALAASLAPGGRGVLIAAAGAAAVVGAVVLAVLFLRWPWLVPVLTLACVPARVPVALEGEDANLLLPLYAVVAGVGLALGWELLRGDQRARELGPLAWPLAAFVAVVGALAGAGRRTCARARSTSARSCSPSRSSRSRSAGCRGAGAGSRSCSHSSWRWRWCSPRSAPASG